MSLKQTIKSNNIKIAGMMIMLALTIVSCDKMDENGKLDGYWQLTEWKDNASGEIIHTNYDSKIFYTIKLELIKMQDATDVRNPMFLSYFHYTTDSLYLDRSFLRPFDDEVPFDSLECVGCSPSGKYAINLLTSRHLTLSNELFTLKFRKY